MSQMRSTLLVFLTLGIASSAFAQGRRGNAQQAQPQQPQQAPPQPQGAPAANAQGQGGRGGGAGEFYNYDSSGTAPIAIQIGPPTESLHKISVNGDSISYAAHAGYVPVTNATTKQPEAEIFYTSYGKDGVSDLSTRPIVFFFGGAPGVSAAWQEFGGLGPKQMKAGTATWADNPATLLGQADLVFVNPVGTAFSRPIVPNHGPAFWTSQGDVASLAEFVRTFIRIHNRGASPLYLAGADHGTARVGGLAAYLIEHQVPLRGIALFSLANSADSTAGDAQYITLLPSLVMSAWYHKKLAADLNNMSAEQISAQARQFASREYLHALYKGDRMTAEERTKVVADLSRLTGTSKQFVISNNLRISLDRFNQELMRDQHKAMSPSDARVAGFTPQAGGGFGGGGGGGRGGFGAAPMIDFNVTAISGGFLSAYESYLRDELKFAPNQEGIYYLLNGGVNNFQATGADDTSLAAAFARQPNLKMFVAVNYYDLSSPFYAAEFTLAHLSLAPEVRAHNITVKNYEAGQMVYMDSKEGPRLGRDLSAFVAEGK